MAELRDVRMASEHTQRAYRHELDQMCLWLEDQAQGLEHLHHLDGRMLRAFVADRAAELAPSSLARCVAALRAWGTFLLATERLDHNPADALRAPKQGRKLPHVLETEDLFKPARCSSATRRDGASRSRHSRIALQHRYARQRTRRIKRL